MYSSKPYKIIEAKILTGNVKMIRLKSNLNPMPGEFIEVSMPGIGECPLASCSYNKNYIDLLVRNAGNVTSAIFKLKKGNTISIRGPYGNAWPYKKIRNKNIMLISGGTGLAPITSFINYVEKNRKDFRQVMIYLGFRDEDNILLKDRIRTWREKFKVTVFIDKNLHQETKFKCKVGFIGESIAKEKINLGKNYVAFLCGPEIMMHSVTDELLEKGMPGNKIYWSLERRMECGFGSCGRCQIQDVYVCKDGPVFRYDVIKPKLDNEESANQVKI